MMTHPTHDPMDTRCGCKDCSGTNKAFDVLKFKEIMDKGPTPSPESSGEWRVGSNYYSEPYGFCMIFTPDELLTLQASSTEQASALATRICECVNYLAGLPSEYLASPNHFDKAVHAFNERIRTLRLANENLQAEVGKRNQTFDQWWLSVGCKLNTNADHRYDNMKAAYREGQKSLHPTTQEKGQKEV